MFFGRHMNSGWAHIKSAYYALGMLNDDKEWNNCL